MLWAVEIKTTTVMVIPLPPVLPCFAFCMFLPDSLAIFPSFFLPLGLVENTVPGHRDRLPPGPIPLLPGPGQQEDLQVATLVLHSLFCSRGYNGPESRQSPALIPCIPSLPPGLFGVPMLCKHTARTNTSHRGNQP